MKSFIPYVTFFILPFLLTTALAQQSQTKERQQLYIGIEKNRLPYTGLNDLKQPHGILVAAVNRLCETINADCEFVVGEFNQLLQDVKIYKLHALIIIDTFILPDIDKLKLTPPLCKTQPVFIQKPNENNRTKPEDFKGTTIGVREGSLLHLYLLDEFSSHARIKPYPLLESGIFDLVTGRIDTLSTDQAFFSERLQKTPLGKEYAATPLDMTQPDGEALPATSMRFALREQDTELYETLTKAIQTNGQPSYCVDILVSHKQSGISIPPPPINFDAPMPEKPEALDVPLSGANKSSVDKPGKAEKQAPKD